MEIRDGRSTFHPPAFPTCVPDASSPICPLPPPAGHPPFPAPTASRSNKSTSPDSVPTATKRGARGQKSIQSTAESTSIVNFGFGSTLDADSPPLTSVLAERPPQIPHANSAIRAAGNQPII